MERLHPLRPVLIVVYAAAAAALLGAWVGGVVPPRLEPLVPPAAVLWAGVALALVVAGRLARGALRPSGPGAVTRA